jgi:hypothetical protein
MSSDNNKTDNIENEWKRSVTNPDNMIVSDSLLGRLALSEPVTEDPATDTFMQCSIISRSGNVVSGRTARFNKSEYSRSVVFETTHSTANSMLKFGEVNEVIFSFPSGETEVVWTVEDAETVSKTTEFFGSNDALITIVIETEKDSKDSNSYTITTEA